MAVHWYLMVNENEYGPLTSAQLKDLAKAGGI